MSNIRNKKIALFLILLAAYIVEIRVGIYAANNVMEYEAYGWCDGAFACRDAFYRGEIRTSLTQLAILIVPFLFIFAIKSRADNTIALKRLGVEIFVYMSLFLAATWVLNFHKDLVKFFMYYLYA